MAITSDYRSVASDPANVHNVHVYQPSAMTLEALKARRHAVWVGMERIEQWVESTYGANHTEATRRYAELEREADALTAEIDARVGEADASVSEVEPSTRCPQARA